jgi:phospholipid-binding lipoprotein MlaA
VFSLNGVIDVFAIEPAARGWRAVTPQGFRDAVERFFDNLEFPVRLLGCLTQGRIAASGQELGRFLVNSTAGVAGLFDPASRIGLEPHKEDLGKSLGIWGLGPGPYLVIPVLGSSSTRDLVDLPLRSAGRLVPGLNLVSAVNTRSGLIAQVDAARAASLDLYLLARRAYFQSRRRPGRAAVLSAEASGG